MRFAFSAPDRNPAERETLMTGFAAHGYDGLQLKRMQYAEFLGSPDQFRPRWGDRPGIASGLITGGKLDEAGIADLLAVIRFGAAAGSERVIFCHGRSRQTVSDDDLVHFSRTLAGIGHQARELGTQLSLHHHYDQPVMHRSDFDRFFARIDDGSVSLTVDTAHLVKSGIDDIAEVIRAFGPRIDTVHIKDIRDGRFVPLGEGTIDFTPVFAAIAEAAPGAWVCADEESGADIDAAMASCRQLMRSGLNVRPSGGQPDGRDPVAASQPRSR